MPVARGFDGSGRAGPPGPPEAADEFRSALARSVGRHSLGWLLAASGVGLWLAALLVWPEAGGAAGGLGYGRWMPLHLNWQLYGWCSLPLVGALLAACLDPRHPGAVRHARVALGGWSLALGLGGLAWLVGVTSGKLFLDWAGWARPLLALAMSLLWTLLAAHLWWSRERAGTARWRVAAGLVGALGPVPAVMYWSAGREVYPALNPDSGGATGASLLGSTLGIVAIYGLLPVLLGVERRRRPAGGSPRVAWFWWAWAASMAVFGRIDRGHASHHAPGQILGLGVLLVWVPLLWFYGYAWAWPTAALRWLVAAGLWWTLLVASGWVTFLPGVSEASKFTHALVGHAHLAMAGLVSSVNFAVLACLAPAAETEAAAGAGAGRGDARVFRLWQGGTAAHVASMIGLGVVEAGREATLFYGYDGMVGFDWVRLIFAARLVAGAFMVAAAWWAWRTVSRGTDGFLGRGRPTLQGNAVGGGADES